MPTTKNRLPDGPTALIALARVAHHDGNRRLEQSVRDKLAREFGLTLGFTCVESVDRELQAEGRSNG